jgi:WD40 repeat protein
MDVTPNELVFACFNQDAGCVACGTQSGFRVHNCEPFKQTAVREVGPIACVEMLFRCNIVALVGGARNARFPPNKVMIWDDNVNRCIGELSFRSDVKAVKMRRDRIVVVLERKVYVYNFANLKLMDHIETVANPQGICGVSNESSNAVLACPGLQQGHVRVELYDFKKTQLILAHQTNLACVAVNADGTRAATASELGTLVRVFDTASGALLQEVRRGADRAQIRCLAFHSDSQWLACASDKGTVHVFRMQCDANPTSSLQFLGQLLPKYFSSEWSFAKYRVASARCVAFGAQPGALLVLGADGALHRAVFDPDNPGQECAQDRLDSVL